MKHPLTHDLRGEPVVTGDGRAARRAIETRECGRDGWKELPWIYPDILAARRAPRSHPDGAVVRDRFGRLLVRVTPADARPGDEVLCYQGEYVRLAKRTRAAP